LLSKNKINSILKRLLGNFCRLTTSQIYPVLIMAGLWPSEISVVYGFRIQHQTPSFWKCVWSFTFVKNYSVCAQSSEPSPQPRPRVLNTSVPSCRNKCSKINTG